MRSLCLAISLVFLSALPVSAQFAPIPGEEFSGVRFYPAAGENNYIGVDGATIGSSTIPPFGLSFDYAFEPIEVFSQCEEAGTPYDCGTVVGEKLAVSSGMFAVQLFGAYAIGDRLQLSLNIPFVFSTGDQLSFVVSGEQSTPIQGGDGFGIGDPRLAAKFRIFGSQPEGFALATMAWVTAPLGQLTAEDRFIGDELPAFGGRVIAEIFADQIRGAVFLGGYFRNARTVITTEVGPMLSYGAALEYRFLRELSLIAELDGSTAFNDAQRIDQLETRFGLRLHFLGLTALLGGGVGLILGPGIPDGRILATFGYAPQAEPESDGDGIVDSEDECPDEPEDQDGYEDQDGCPDVDNDLDELLDSEDQCPDRAEDQDGYEDEDGCPDEDNDNDGVRDGYDSCPDTPEDMDGDRDDDGCPDQDRDRDGVQDSEDRCPDEPEDTDGLADTDGCPEDDADEDGISDEDDECPEVGEDPDR
ncbi:MAG: hypothetical protein AAGF12_41615, partial [Myxococcota bacterium]